MTVTTTPETNLFLLLVLLAAGCSNRADDCEAGQSGAAARFDSIASIIAS